jgi:hypothetical protein
MGKPAIPKPAIDFSFTLNPIPFPTVKHTLPAARATHDRIRWSQTMQSAHRPSLLPASSLTRCGDASRAARSILVRNLHP